MTSQMPSSTANPMQIHPPMPMLLAFYAALCLTSSFIGVPSEWTTFVPRRSLMT